jgi:acyl-coenzyme A synthetase/AMP-(fatty) acid ligase
VGYVRADGRLVLAGRIDDCVRTREGRLVNLAHIADRLRDVTGIHDAAVVPIQALSGPSFGAVVACSASEDLGELRRRITSTLPDWAWPRAVVQVSQLPRLVTGKLDRAHCVALLSGGG